MSLASSTIQRAVPVIQHYRSYPALQTGLTRLFRCFPSSSRFYLLFEEDRDCPPLPKESYSRLVITGCTINNKRKLIVLRERNYEKGPCTTRLKPGVLQALLALYPIL
jgi:hypothetical protein